MKWNEAMTAFNEEQWLTGHIPCIHPYIPPKKPIHREFQTVKAGRCTEHIFLYDPGPIPLQRGSLQPKRYLATPASACSRFPEQWCQQELQSPLVQVDIWHPEATTHYFYRAHYYRKLPRIKIWGSWEEEPEICGTNKNQKSYKTAKKERTTTTTTTKSLKGKIKSCTSAIRTIPMFREDGRLIQKFSPQLNFKFLCSARAGSLCLSLALSPLAAQFNRWVNAGLSTPIKAVSVLLCIEWTTRKQTRTPQEATTSLALLKLKTTTSACAVLCLPKAFEVNSLKLARSSSELRRALSRVAGGPAGGLQLAHSRVQVKVGCTR